MGTHPSGTCTHTTLACSRPNGEVEAAEQDQLDTGGYRQAKAGSCPLPDAEVRKWTVEASTITAGYRREPRHEPSSISAVPGSPSGLLRCGGWDRRRSIPSQSCLQD